MREGWELKTLSDVSDVRDGTHDSPKYQEEGYPLITSKNLKNGKLSYNKIKYISEKDYININKRSKVDVGDILFAMIGTIGNPVIIKEEPNYAIKNVALFKVYDNYDSSFIKYYFDSAYVVKKMQSEAKGTTQKFVGLGYLRKFPIVVPPLKEQKQIVTTLDKAFKQIDQAKANLEKNLNSAKELFQSKLNEVFSQRGEGWEENRLKEITTKIGSGSTPRGGQASYKESGISLIRSMNVHDDGFREKKLAFIDDEQALKLKNVTLEKEDVLLNITGASVARCCIVPDNFLPARVNQHVSIIRLKENILHPSYLHYCLTAQENKNKLLNIGRQGATREAITKVQIENFIISYPKDMNKQLEVLEALHVIKEKSNLLQTHYQQKLNNLEELKKSILQKAFKGELV